MSFQIAGIKILPNCLSSIRKVLKKDDKEACYLFSARYSRNENELILDIKGDANSCAKSLYDIESGGHSIEVTVNAIVGRNGDGKSALVELLIRILNNFAHKYGFLDNQKNIQFIDGVYAILYYEIDGAIYAIKCEGKAVGWYKDGALLNVGERTDSEKKQLLKKNFQSDLFYTMVINYSLYAYTPASLGGSSIQDSHWIDNIFHKNDSYQTPVVISPVRTNGNIDIIKEEYMSKQRLLSLFVVSAKNGNSRKISSTEEAVGYAFSFENENRFIKNTINDFLFTHLQDDLIWYDLKPYTYPGERVPDIIINRFKDFWGTFRTEIEDNARLIKCFFYTLSNVERARKTDLRRYLTCINETANPKNPKLGRRLNNVFGPEFRELISSKGVLSNLNYRQFYRLLLILMIWKVLTSTNQCGMLEESLDLVLSDINDPKNAAKLYLVYKFISIVETYPGFCIGGYISDDSFTPLLKGWPDPDIMEAITQDLKKILRTKDYRTLEFIQTINYLKAKNDDYGAESCSLPGIKFDYYLSFDSLNKQTGGKSLKEIQWYMPCPVFDGDIVLYNGEDYYPMDKLSSGMIQRLNSVGSLIYHLRNLDEEQTGKTMLEYDNTSVIMEEVELYYHPEYQKSYINYLLEQIERAQLSRLKRLNLIFITHSPFVLSDILKENLLCLNDGCQEEIENLHTFGANIHDMLRNPFFMKNGTIGDYAQRLINKIVVSLAVYEVINREKDHNPSKVFTIDQFRKDYEELRELMDFLPQDQDGILSYSVFIGEYSKNYLKDAIDLIDEPIVKGALKRSFKRIFEDYVASPSTIKKDN